MVEQERHKAAQQPVRRRESEIALLRQALANYREELRRLDERSRPVPFYVSSGTRKKFHRPNCKWAAWIPARKQRHFDHREEAIEAGLRPCGTCSA